MPTLDECLQHVWSWRAGDAPLRYPLTSWRDGASSRVRDPEGRPVVIFYKPTDPCCHCSQMIGGASSSGPRLCPRCDVGKGPKRPVEVVNKRVNVKFVRDGVVYCRAYAP
jgi:hypothetical protein